MCIYIIYIYIYIYIFMYTYTYTHKWKGRWITGSVCPVDHEGHTRATNEKVKDTLHYLDTTTKIRILFKKVKFVCLKNKTKTYYYDYILISLKKKKIQLILYWICKLPRSVKIIYMHYWRMHYITPSRPQGCVVCSHHTCCIIHYIERSKLVFFV